MSVTLKPVPKMIVSTSCSAPLSVTTAFSVTLAIGSVTSSTLSRPSAGYQWLEGRIRLQPIV